MGNKFAQDILGASQLEVAAGVVPLKPLRHMEEIWTS